MVDNRLPSSPTEKIAYFGYGSLVNLSTLRTPYISAHPARVRGWRRTWLARPRDVEGFARVDGLAFLSVVPDPNCTIDGVVIVDHAASLDDLDRREVLYERETVPWDDCAILDKVSFDCRTDVFLYAAAPEPATHKDPEPQILRSYLDAVCQGFLSHFGERGLTDFKASTDNFHFQVLEDRGRPLYPRPVILAAEEQSVIDQHFPPSVEHGSV